MLTSSKSSFLPNFMYALLHVQSLSHIQLFATPWTVAHQASLSVGFSRQEYWTGLPCPLPGNWPGSSQRMCPSPNSLYLWTLFRNGLFHQMSLEFSQIFLTFEQSKLLKASGNWNDLWTFKGAKLFTVVLAKTVYIFLYYHTDFDPQIIYFQNKKWAFCR